MIFLFGVIFGARLRIECMGTANFGGYSHCKVANFDSNCYDFDILKGRIFGYLRKKVIILLPYFETTVRIFSNTGSKAEISRMLYDLFLVENRFLCVSGIASFMVTWVH